MSLKELEFDQRMNIQRFDCPLLKIKELDYQKAIPGFFAISIPNIYLDKLKLYCKWEGIDNYNNHDFRLLKQLSYQIEHYIQHYSHHNIKNFLSRKF
jgi:hypothetical protein